MSDKYIINGVTIEPQAGGYYLLTHASLAEPRRERGKEAAEAAAEEIGKAAEGDGTITGQGELDPAALQALTGGATPPTAPAAPVGDSAEVAELKAKLAKAEAEAKEKGDELKDVKKELKTRTAEAAHGAGEAPVKSAIPASIPREYTGPLDDKRKAEMKRLGIEMTDIILEESDTIPPTGLFVSHNGRGYVIKPGEKVTVPDFLLNVLDDAQMAAPVTDSGSMKVLGYRNRMRYPYRRV